MVLFEAVIKQETGKYEKFILQHYDLLQ